MELEGRIAPPMANGELTFDAPWQGRVFGMARSLCERGMYEWDEFRQYLITEIETWEQAHGAGTPYEYYDRFLAALECLLADRGLCSDSDLGQRASLFEARPHGHDH